MFHRKEDTQEPSRAGKRKYLIGEYEAILEYEMPSEELNYHLVIM